MVDLVISLLPLALGIVASPLAIMALVAVLLSDRARQNGLAYFVGWTLAIIVVLAVSLLLFALVGIDERSEPPMWTYGVRLLLGVLLALAAVVVYRRGRARVIAMAKAVTPTDVVEAAPQLPGWLHAVASFTPGRSGALGFGIFALNPVDLSCAVLAGLDIQLAAVSAPATAAVAIVFVVVGAAPIAIPVFLVLARGERATPVLTRLRGWIASHSTQLNAALLLFIAIVQLQKAISGLIGS